MSVLLRLVLGVFVCSLWSLEASAWDRGDVERFATLPAGRRLLIVLRLII